MRRTTAAGALALAAWVVGCGADSHSSRTLRTVPAATPVRSAARPPDHIPGQGALTAYVTVRKVLRARPGGRTLATLPAKTEYGSPQILSVVARRGWWIAVLASQLSSGRVGWIDGRTGVELFRTPWSLDADLSRRLLTVRRRGRVLARVPVAVGLPSAPTPRGRFAVTDKLFTNDPGGPYGCCVLALTGHQPNIPQGWTGGDRIAIHSTPATGTIGQAASHGCLRATNGVMRRLVREIPLGTPLRVRA